MFSSELIEVGDRAEAACGDFGTLAFGGKLKEASQVHAAKL
jgi:hypothetical protein